MTLYVTLANGKEREWKISSIRATYNKNGIVFHVIGETVPRLLLDIDCVRWEVG